MTFVRSQSVHFDLDSNGYVPSIEVMGPPRSGWQACELKKPQEIEIAELRFLEPEQCEEEEIEQFKSAATGATLVIVFLPRSPVRFASPADGLIFGVDEIGELAELWIENIELRV